jgi:hypothetical protein
MEGYGIKSRRLREWVETGCRADRGSVEQCRQLRSLSSPERLRVYALKRFAAQARRPVATWSYSRTPPYAPLVQVAVAFPSRGLRTELDAPFRPDSRHAC